MPSRHLTLSALALAGATSALLSACGPLPDEEDPAESRSESRSESIDRALNGTITWGTGAAACTQTQKDFMTQAMIRAASHTTGPHTAAMMACLKEGTLAGGVTTGSEATYPEWILKRMGENMPTKIECRDLPGLNAQAPLNISNEVLSVNRSAVNDAISRNDVRGWTGTLLHEIAHNKGYQHPVSEMGSGKSSIDYRHSVNEELAFCSGKVSDGATYGFGARSTFANETTLAPVGLEGGSSGANPWCTANDFAVGVGVRTGNQVVAMGLIRSPPSLQTVDFQPLLGGPGGTAKNLSCFGGEMLVGLHGTADIFVNSVGPVCQSVANIQAGSTAGRFFDPKAGGTSGREWERVCPPFMTIKALHMRTGGLVDRLEVVCQDVRQPKGADGTNFAAFGGPGNANSRKYDEFCPGRAAMMQLDVSGGSAINRAAMICKGLHRGASGLAKSGPFQKVPGHGGNGGTVKFLDCDLTPTFSANRAMVGLKMSTNGKVITSIQPVCANDLVGWGNGTSTSKSLAAAAGTVGGTVSEFVCPAQHFLIGWGIKAGNSSGQTLVEHIQGLCRRF